MDGIIPSNPVASLATALYSRVMGDLESRIEQVNRYYRWRRGCRRGTRVSWRLGDGVRVLGIAMGIAAGIGEPVRVGLRDCSGIEVEGGLGRPDERVC